MLDFMPAKGKCCNSFLRLLFASSVVWGVVGCEAERLFGDGDKMQTAINQNVYNYTRYDFIDIVHQDAAERWDISRATRGGATFADEANIQELGSGIIFHAEEMLCCIRWRPVTGKDVILRVKWLAVFDRPAYEKALSLNDERHVKTSLAGSQWCEALVTVSKPYPVDPDVFSLHFMPDGTLQAYVSKFKESGPLPVDAVLKHTPTSGPVLCQTPTSNPFYGIPRPAHRE